MADKINVLVVEDSPVAQLLLVHILNSDERLQVIGTANNGLEALAFIDRHIPDVIVMDIHMPGMDGFETTRRIMETRPVPIVICSASLNPAEVAKTMRAVEVGALAIVGKPVGLGHDTYETLAKALTDTVAAMSEVKVVRRWARAEGRGAAGEQKPAQQNGGSAHPAHSDGVQGPIKVVVIGASTGGPPALMGVLSHLPKDFPAPILIVQHIVAGFLTGLAEWLEQTSGIPVRIAEHGKMALPGHAYLAADGYHMGVTPAGQIVLSKSEPENGLRPAVSHLFRSARESFGAQAVGILLTGMGKDGAVELRAMRDAGAMTFAQDAESSVVNGMPGEAARLEGACQILPPEKISNVLAAMTQRMQVQP